MFRIITVVWALTAMTAFADDISALQDRLIADYKTGTYSSASSYLSSQQSDGSWSDINYDDRSRTGWEPNTHLGRLKQMAISYKRSANAGMLSGIEKGLNYWYMKKPTSDNWWFNDIGQQQAMGPILIMVEDDIDAALVTTGATYMNDPSKTGQNLVWLATETVWRGCLNESLADINKGLDAIKGGLKITTGEGIQLEGSFYQHHEQLYNGGYGRGYVNDVGYWIYMTRGLGFAYSQDKMDVLSTLMLDGTQWMIRRGRIDPSCAGREITRPGNGASSSFLTQLDRFTGIDASRGTEYAAMATHIRGNNDGVLTGNKHFWRTDYHVQRRSGYHMSVKMCSKRTYGTEVINSENTQGRYLPFGCTYVLVDGDEYADIFPVWDWARIPGVTAPQTGVKVTMPGSYVIGTTDFVGGASNGVYGAAVLDFSYDNTVAKKSWFFFNEGCMALGAGITGTGGLPVYTSVNQCHKDGDVTVSTGGAGSTAGTGQQTLSNPAWVHHGNVGYVFPGSDDVVLKNEVQNGRWYDISTPQSKDAVSEDVFSLWFDHGTDPSGAVYQYAVLPGMSKSAVQSFAGSNPLQVLSNTVTIQAVRHTGDDVTGVIFHAPGQLALGNGTTVKSDKACAMLVDESGDTASVTVSNPLATAITVTVDLIYSGADDVQYIFNLPSGAEAGKSMTLGSAGSGGTPPDTSDTGGGTPGDTASVDGIGVIASGDDGNVAANTLDGDFDTRWSSSGDGEWIQYDLGASKSIAGINAAFFRGDERSTHFDVSVSENGTDWTVVLIGAESGGASLGMEAFPFSAAQDGRYVLITGHGNSDNDWNSYTEVRIDTVVGGTGGIAGERGGLGSLCPSLPPLMFRLDGAAVNVGDKPGTGVYVRYGNDGFPVKTIRF